MWSTERDEAMNPMIRTIRRNMWAALLAAALVGATGCAEVQNLRANSEAQAKRIDELEKAQRKMAEVHAQELRKMQGDVDKAKADAAMAQSDLRKAQTLKSENELALERTNQQLSKEVADKSSNVEKLSKDLDQHITSDESSQKKVEDLQAKLKEKTDALAKAEADLKAAKAEVASLTEKVGDAKKSGDEAADLKAKLAEAKKAGASDSDSDLDEAYTLLKASMKPLADDNLVYVARDSRGVVVGLKADYVFDSGSTAVSDQCHPTLEKVAEVFGKYPKKYVEVQGHTDPQPVVNQVYVDNWALASARADNVVRYLADQTKIPASHLKGSSCAEYRPTDSSGDGEKMRRRVDLVLSSKP